MAATIGMSRPRNACRIPRYATSSSTPLETPNRMAGRIAAAGVTYSRRPKNGSATIGPINVPPSPSDEDPRGTDGGLCPARAAEADLLEAAPVGDRHESSQPQPDAGDGHPPLDDVRERRDAPRSAQRHVRTQHPGPGERDADGQRRGPGDSLGAAAEQQPDPAGEQDDGDRRPQVWHQRTEQQQGGSPTRHQARREHGSASGHAGSRDGLDGTHQPRDAQACRSVSDSDRATAPQSVCHGGPTADARGSRRRRVARGSPRVTSLAATGSPRGPERGPA